MCSYPLEGVVGCTIRSGRIMLKFIHFIFCTVICFLTPFISLSAEQTLAMIKPDAVKAQHIGEIIARYEKAGLRIAALKMVRLTPKDAAEFYAVHKERPFYWDLVQFVSSGPVVVIVLDGENAIAKNREVIGATDPKKSAKGTIRGDFGSSVEQNAIHGSDAAETAAREILFFFKPQEIVIKSN